MRSPSATRSLARAARSLRRTRASAIQRCTRARGTPASAANALSKRAPSSASPTRNSGAIYQIRLFTWRLWNTSTSTSARFQALHLRATSSSTRSSK